MAVIDVGMNLSTEWEESGGVHLDAWAQELLLRQWNRIPCGLTPIDFNVPVVPHSGAHRVSISGAVSGLPQVPCWVTCDVSNGVLGVSVAPKPDSDIRRLGRPLLGYSGPGQTQTVFMVTRKRATEI